MPAKRARLMFTPSKRALHAIRRVAKVTDKPTSSVVSENIDILAEHLENMAAILEQAKLIQEKQPQAVLDAARAAFEKMAPILDRTQADMEAVLADAHEQIAMFDEPPPSNTGATSESGPPPAKAANG